MKKVTFLGVFLVLALTLVACAPAPAAPNTPTGFPNEFLTEAPTLSLPVVGETETPVAVSTDTVMETATVGAAMVTATDIGTGAGITIMTSTSASTSEPFLVDNQGRALYLFTTDTQNSGTSACTGECLTEWPPLIVTGTPQGGPGVDASLLGTITREDGSLQATYNGWPLYYYAGDQAPGDTTGQGLEGVWFLVSGTGNSIQP